MTSHQQLMGIDSQSFAVTADDELKLSKVASEEHFSRT